MLLVFQLAAYAFKATLFPELVPRGLFSEQIICGPGWIFGVSPPEYLV
jgi:hypothetical protein